MRLTVADGLARAQAEPSTIKTAVEAKVNEQYDSDASMAFYEHVMGGGGDDIHYGIFRKEKDGLKQSSQNSVEELARMAVECGALKQGKENSTVYVLDLGSGKGGAARWLATTFGCHVTCFNLGERQNALNIQRAEATGIGHLIDSHLGSFNEPLPIEWTDRFDMVWSQEAFCHCVDHAALLGEVQRVLKPGGTIVFSDIMQGDAGGDCSSFTGQNVVTKLATPQMYKDAIASCGMRLHEHRDLTEHLTPYFKCMLEAVRESKLPLQMKGVSMTRLQAYEEDLAVRFDAVKQRHFAWGMFSAQNLFSNDALLNGALNGENLCQDQLEECINAQYDSEASMTFYQYTMGGGSDYVHYGIFNSPDDDLKTASHNTVELLAELGRRVSSLGLSQGKNVRVLDLGAGKGGAARYLAATFGCHVTCYNLGQNQNKHNLEKAKEEGLEGLIACRQGNFNNGLPAEWTTSFDLVWSQEAFCHAKSQTNLLKEIKRVLKPGGAAVFTDIMRMEPHTASVADLTSLARQDDMYEEPDSPTVAADESSPVTDADTPESPDTPTDSIPIPARNTSVMVSAASASSLATSFCSTSVPRDFPGEGGKKRLSKKTIHASSPDVYMANIKEVGLQLVEYRDLSDQLVPFYTRMCDEVKANEQELIAKGISAKRVESMQTDLAHRMGAVQDGGLAWGVFTFRKPANSNTLVVGGGPLGALVAMRMSQSGVSNVTLKVLPTAPHQVQEMAAMSGVKCVEQWEDVDNTHMWGTIIIAVKTHWLPHIALEMSCMQITFENLCMVYNGYTQTPEYFTGPGCTRAVVPQSFSFQQDAPITWDVKHGNTMNPWTLPHGKPSATVVGQLTQSSICAVCDPSFHRSAFFKFCVNNAANLLSVIEQKCCRDLCTDPQCVATMRSILQETLDVLENDLFFAALVPMHRELFIQDVIHNAKGSVRSYDFHFPSSYQHYKQMKLVDTRALNGFVVRKGRELSKAAPVNEYVARQVIAISAATMRGIPRPEWDLRVQLSAAKRLISYAGMDVNVWGHASSRVPVSEESDPSRMLPQSAGKMLLAGFGETFSEARASSLQQLPFHPRDLTEEERAGANITAIVLHGAVYSARPDVFCVLHTHSPYATAMAAADVDFDPEIIQDAMQFVGRVAYHDFGGVADEEEEMELVSKVAKDADIVVLRNHGVLVLGEDIELAYSRLYYYERCCQCQLLVMGSGKKVKVPGAIGVKHTVDWYRKDGKESAHAEWKAHMRELLHKENAASNPVFWYE